MSQQENILFITDKQYVDFDIPGGVQICTQEFITYFETAGYNLIIIKVKPSLTFAKRLKIRLGLETYGLYDPEAYLSEIQNAISTYQIKFILFNQLNLAHWAPKIRQQLNHEIKCIGLSHGNESGDYLYEITQGNQTPKLLETWRMGKLITKEKLLFATLLDAVITISTQESNINQWLGAKKIFFLPRILSPQFISWKPEQNVIGFIGTLDHYPNFGGVDMLANQLKKQNFDGILKIIGGPTSIGEGLAAKFSFIKYCGQLNNQEVAAEISTWSIFVNPIFWYARGSSTKVAQIISWGIPVLSTKAGIRGYDLIDENFLTSQDEPEELAKLIIRSLKSPPELNQLKKIAELNAQNFQLNVWAEKLALFLSLS